MEAPKTQVYRQPADAVWLITGCSSGIGKAVAEHVFAQGHRLVATARKLSALDYLPDNEPKILKLSLDVSSSASIDAAVAAVLARFGRIDVLVNNAGYGVVSDTEAVSDAAARDVFETNFWGAVRLTRHALRVMREDNAKAGSGGSGGSKQGGVVLNVSSMGGRIGFAGMAFYNASKFALEGFTEAVSKEVLPEWNIHFCCVEPGGVETKFVANDAQNKKVWHPAYEREDQPTRQLDKYLSNPDVVKNFASPEAIAAAMYSIVAREQPIPLRLPLGPDAWGGLRAELMNWVKEHDKLRELSNAVGKEGQLDSVKFLISE